MLPYIDKGSYPDESEDPLVGMIERRVTEANSDREWRRRAMGVHDVGVRP